MTHPTPVETVRFEGERMWVGLSDGRVIGVPIAWFPRLMRATAAEREAFSLSPFGIHWEALDEDVSVERLLAGDREVANAIPPAGGLLSGTKVQAGDSLKRISPIEKGERLWIWYAEEPSSFEVLLAECLSSFPLGGGDAPAPSVFHVDILSWRASSALLSNFVKNLIPRPLEFPSNKIASFISATGEHHFSIPKPTISYDGNNKITYLRYDSDKKVIYNQIVLVIASPQEDHDAEAPSLAGYFDILGLISLMSGMLLFNRPLASGYFCTKRRKFINGEIASVPDPAISKAILPFGHSGNGLDAQDERTHAALWFAGKAFAATDFASKVVFYRTALEIIGGKQFKNYFGRIYRRDSKTKIAADEKLSEIEKLRAEVIHFGRAVKFSAELERFVQAAIIDGLVFKKDSSNTTFAMTILCNLSEQARMAAAENS